MTAGVLLATVTSLAWSRLSCGLVCGLKMVSKSWLQDTSPVLSRAMIYKLIFFIFLFI